MRLSRYRFDDIGFFKKAVFATVPEGEMASSVRNQQIIIQGMESGSRKSLL